MIGKTGSGKTTVSALVAMAGAARGLRVVAVDTDTSPNLGGSLGLDEAAGSRARSVPRALARGRGGGGVTVAQVLDGYATPTPSGVTLLHAMSASDEPAGCGCPAHASARSLLASVLTEEFDIAVLDMETGFDHLDRPDGTLAHADAVLVVVDPSRKSVVTGGRMVARAREFGASYVGLVGNKAVASEGDLDLLAGDAHEHGVALAGVVPLSPDIAAADRSGRGLEPSADVRAAADQILGWVLAAR